MAGIARVESGRLDYSLAGEFKFFRAGVRPGRIRDIFKSKGVLAMD